MPLLDNLSVVFLYPQDPVNIAATVRAMKNMGVATYRVGEAGKAQLFKRADEKLYLAKTGGRNRVES